jgi:hypothetical protein
MVGPRKRGRLAFSIIILLCATLACNAPGPLLRSFYFGKEPEELISFEREKLAEFEATLISEEGEIEGLKPPHGTDWACEEIYGVVAEIQKGAAAFETMELKKAEIDMTLSYDGEDNWMSLQYKTEFERDMAVQGVNGQIEAWDHEKWSDNGSAGRMQLWKNGIFTGLIHITTSTTNSYPQKTSSKFEMDYNLFGLVNPLNYQQVYVCNLGRNEIPENLRDLTYENFLDHCAFYTYACYEK